MASATRPRTRIRPRRRFPISVARYDAMIEAGILTRADRVELIEGELVPKTPRERAHGHQVRKIVHLLESLAIPGWFVIKEDPAALSNWSKPEPDAALVRGNLDDFEDRDVTAADVGLVIEVAHTSLADDRGIMLSMYAACGRPVYWIVNLRRDQLEVYTEPSGSSADPIGYRHCRILQPGGHVAVMAGEREARSIAVSDLLPRHESTREG